MTSRLLYFFGILNAQYKFDGSMHEFEPDSHTQDIHLFLITLIIVQCSFYISAFNRKFVPSATMKSQESKNNRNKQYSEGSL